jgi:hypothetical protein
MSTWELLAIIFSLLARLSGAPGPEVLLPVLYYVVPEWILSLLRTFSYISLMGGLIALLKILKDLVATRTSFAEGSLLKARKATEKADTRLKNAQAYEIELKNTQAELDLEKSNIIITFSSPSRKIEDDRRLQTEYQIKQRVPRKIIAAEGEPELLIWTENFVAGMEYIEPAFGLTESRQSMSQETKTSPHDPGLSGLLSELFAVCIKRLIALKWILLAEPAQRMVAHNLLFRHSETGRPARKYPIREFLTFISCSGRADSFRSLYSRISGHFFGHFRPLVSYSF